MSSAICFNLDQSKILSSGNVLKVFAQTFFQASGILELMYIIKTMCGFIALVLAKNKLWMKTCTFRSDFAEPRSTVGT